MPSTRQASNSPPKRPRPTQKGKGKGKGKSKEQDVTLSDRTEASSSSQAGPSTSPRRTGKQDGQSWLPGSPPTLDAPIPAGRKLTIGLAHDFFDFFTDNHGLSRADVRLEFRAGTAAAAAGKEEAEGEWRAAVRINGLIVGDANGDDSDDGIEVALSCCIRQAVETLGCADFEDVWSFFLSTLESDGQEESQVAQKDGKEVTGQKRREQQAEAPSPRQSKRKR